MTSSRKLARHAIVFLLPWLAACAQNKCAVLSHQPRVPVPASQPSLSVHDPALDFKGGTVVRYDAAPDFARWLMAFELEARAKGIGQPVLDNAFAGVTAPLPQIVEHDKTQPEKTQTFSQYMAGFITPAKVRVARAQWSSHADILHRIERQYSVPAPVLLALWHTESRFGKYQGHYSIIQSLATLAYDGRRSEFFRAQLMDALTLLQREGMDASELKGSWAGAMGQVQFMPSSFLAYAVDFDGDGRKDIWTDDADALASMANYLHSKGWDENLAWGFPVTIPDGPQSAEWLRTKEKHTADQWNALGLSNEDGSALDMRDPSNHLLRLVMPDNDPANAYLVTSNYDVIMDWNRSVYFATGVLRLADAIKPE